MNWTMLAAGSVVAVAVAGCAMRGRTSTGDPTGEGKAAPVESATITVQVDKPGARVSPTMWGAFFEDINFGGDGGLYAEMVKNRSFEFPDAMMGWFPIIPSLAHGEVTVRTEDPFRETNPHYIRIHSTANPAMGVSNEGFRGMGVKGGELYDFSTQIRGVEGTPKVWVEIVGNDGTTLDSEPLTGIGAAWGKVTATLRTKDTDGHARLAVFMEGKGTIDLDFVSLFPRDTWKGRPGGLRKDMVQMLADMHPGFLRFPGGCIVEGSDLSKRYQWKNTIGPIEDRKLLIDRWNYEFKHRPTPDYFQSFGLGFYEYFQLAEDIGAEPLPLVNAGMACQFNSGELCPIDELGPYIQDALDLIEFANGPADSTWGAKRAAMGHPAPFNLKMMGIGNEQWGPQFLERLTLFTKAIKEKYPDFKIVSDAGPSPEDERFNFLWPKLVEMKADIVDQHCYANPIWFLANSDRYDNYDRNGPKVFFGEYAAQSVAIVSTKNRNNLECALSEAAYMTGLERNAEVVVMASYAPLFANEEAWQWTPNLIWTNSLKVRATPNYYVQQLYSENRGDVVLPTTNTAPVREMLPAGRIGVGTFRTAAEFKDVHVTRGSQPFFASDFSRDNGDWSGSDQWQVANDAFQQNDPEGTVTSFAGDAKWNDYTLELKARKLGGSEGFIITVCDDGAGSRAQWILGGWGNTQHGIQSHFAEQDQLIDRVPGTIETNRWYDIKIVMQGARMTCYLDGQQVQSAEVLKHRVPALFTSATRDEKTGETILKVVNPGGQAWPATIDLRGAGSVLPTGQVTVLTGQLEDENTFEQPDTVAPTVGTVTGISPKFTYSFGPRSLTVLRLGTQNAATTSSSYRTP